MTVWTLEAFDLRTRCPIRVHIRQVEAAVTAGALFVND
jgi:hypothetical protein